MVVTSGYTIKSLTALTTKQNEAYNMDRWFVGYCLSLCLSYY
ncbi:hypothetical protein DFP93_109112 [Aneurinibacillus soli]|uniref:Uncharacterized protein n=1 Tax=Aneurinibacillus soli TaxID=1500254 RepID=A0A0U5B0I5_9BACL|nr:hypothetical protein DFP93_109112 [Aneurinibacillus soli]BAU27760.1 hypothetical protein CB4_01934 [Aneurinibacillus soli]